MLKTILNDMTKEEIIKFVDKYDTYITNFVDDNENYRLKTDVIPQNMIEYYDEYINSEEVF